MECQRVRTELGEYAARDLPGARHRALAAHLQDCPGCHAAFEAELALRETAQAALAFQEAPYSFADLKRRMATIEPLQEVLVLLPKLQSIGVAPRFAVALVLLVCYGGLFYALRNTTELYAACRNPKILAQRDFVSREFIDIYKTVYADTPARKSPHDV